MESWVPMILNYDVAQLHTGQVWLPSHIQCKFDFNNKLFLKHHLLKGDNFFIQLLLHKANMKK